MKKSLFAHGEHIFDGGDYIFSMGEYIISVGEQNRIHLFFPDFVIVSPKNLHQRVWRFSDVLPSALFGCKPPCSEVV